MMSANIALKHAQLLSESNTFNVVISRPFAKCPLGKTWGETLDKSIDLIKPPTDFGIGLLTGYPPKDKVPNQTFKAQTILAIDIDVFEDSEYAVDLAEAIFLALGKKFMELETCPATRTPSGGFHYYTLMGMPRINTKGAVKQRSVTYKDRTTILPIDVRGDGGFIIVAPTKYAGKPDSPNHWKNRFTGQEYTEIDGRELCEENLTQVCSPQLANFLTSSDNIIIDDNYNIIIEQARAPAPIHNNADKPTITAGLVPNEECLKLVLAGLADSDFGAREDWFSTTLELIHTFATTFGGQVDITEFIYHYNKRCKLAADNTPGTNYNADGNARKVHELWNDSKETVRGPGSLMKRLQETRLPADYSAFIDSLVSAGVYVKEPRNTTFTCFGDIINITNETTLEEATQFLNNTVRYIVGGTSAHCLIKVRDVVPSEIPGLRKILAEHIDRYYDWKVVPCKELYSRLEIYTINWEKKDIKGRRIGFHTLKDAFLNAKIRRGITYNSSTFIPTPATNTEKYEVIQSNLEVCGDFNRASPFRAVPTNNTKEQSYANKGVQALLNHMRVVLTNRNPEAYKFLLGWFAHIVQNPTVKTGCSVILRDRNNGGSGKTTFADIMGNGVFGALYKKYNGIGDFQHKFEYDKTNKLFVFIDELDATKIDLDRFKSTITSVMSEEERKGVDKANVCNYNNILCASNNPDLFNLKPGEYRKFVMFDVNKEFSCDKKYFEPLINITQEDCDEMLNYLLQVDIETETNFKLGRGFITDTTLSQQAASLDSVSRLLVDMHQGTFKSYNRQVSTNADGWTFHINELYTEYQRHTNDNRMMAYKLPKFTEELTAIFGTPSRLLFNGARKNGYKLTSAQLETALKKHLKSDLLDYLDRQEDEVDGDCDTEAETLDI